MRSFSDETLGVVFSPGGYTGAYSAGFATALYEAGIKPDYVQGCSVGALIGALLVQEDFNVNRLLDIWLEVEEGGPATLFDKTDILRRILDRRGRYWNNVFTSEGLEALIDENIDFRKVVESDIELRIVVRNETKNRMEIYSNHDEAFQDNPDLFRDIVVASASIPGVFPPVKIGDHFYCDGEVLELSDAVDFGCDRILVLVNESLEQEPEDPSDQFFWERMMNSKHYHYLHHLRDFVDIFEDETIVFYPRERIISASHFERGDIREAIASAYREANRILEDV